MLQRPWDSGSICIDLAFQVTRLSPEEVPRPARAKCRSPGVEHGPHNQSWNSPPFQQTARSLCLGHKSRVPTVHVRAWKPPTCSSRPPWRARWGGGNSGTPPSFKEGIRGAALGNSHSQGSVPCPAVCHGGEDRSASGLATHDGPSSRSGCWTPHSAIRAHWRSGSNTLGAVEGSPESRSENSL